MNTSRTGRGALPVEELAGMAEALRALAHADRLVLLDILDREEEVPVHALVGASGLPQAIVSAHLARMRRAGLVRARRQGQEVWYGIQNRHAVTILDCIRRKAGVR